jgi:DNA-binding NarL/FixJ family response regulator
MLIADDHELLRTGIRAMLASEPDLEVVWGRKTAPRPSPSAESCVPNWC